MQLKQLLQTIGLASVLGLVSVAGAFTINDQPVGFASLNGGTTGGSGGTVVVASTIADLQNYASSSSTYIIYVSGVMGTDVTGTTDATGGNMSVVTVKGNKTIFGLPGSKLIGRILIKGVSNVIIRNMTIQGPGAVDVNGQDAMTIQTSTNVWIDHCDIYDGQDGNLDIVNNSNNITVSWTKFHYTSNSVAAGATGAHRFSSLICGTTDVANTGYYQITMQYNWWADGVTERMPRVRYGKVDVVNNLVTSSGNNYAVRAGLNASIIVESNAFIGTKNPVDIYSSESGQAVTVLHNLFSGISGTTAGTGTAAFSRSTYYSNLTILDSSKVQAAVQGAYGAGATLCDVRTSTCTSGTSSSSVSVSSSSIVPSSSSVVVSSSSAIPSSSSVVVSSSSNTVPVLASIEAEDFCTANGVLETKNAGYLGSGYLNLDATAGVAATWAVNAAAAGNVVLSIRYANGGTADRAMQISRNGISVLSSASFPVTGAWTTWTVVNYTIGLDAGRNELTFTSLGTDGPNLDQIGFNVSTVTSTTCTVSSSSSMASSSSAVASSSSSTPVSIRDRVVEIPSGNLIRKFDLLGRNKNK